VAYLSKIFIYPFKSLEPVSLDRAKFLKSGALEGDRTFALRDASGEFVNGKRNPRVHLLRSSYDPFTGFIRLGRPETGLTATLHIENDKLAIEEWLSEFFSMPVTVVRNMDVGFPDDLDCPGPTLISTATLEEVARWFPPLTAKQMRIRFRTNLEIADVPAFWEDHLYTVKGSRVQFRIGQCVIEGNNPCQRCAVPPRDPYNGQTYKDFAMTFGEKRRELLPAWAEKSRFNHFYRLATNTIVPEDQAGRTINVGDEIEIIGPIS
jgi:uncharacterized protein YcbX